MINPRRSWRCIFFSLFLFLISLSLFSSQLRNLPRTLNGLVSPSAPLLRADLFYLFAQPRGKSADYVEIPFPKPCESTSFQSFSRSFLFSFSPFLSSSQAFECLLACSSSVSITRSPPNKSIVSYRRLFSPIFARLSTRPIPRDHEAFTGEKPGDRQDQFKQYMRHVHDNGYVTMFFHERNKIHLKYGLSG